MESQGLRWPFGRRWWKSYKPWVHGLMSPWRLVLCRSRTRYPGNPLRILVDLGGSCAQSLVASIAEVSGDRGRHVAVTPSRWALIRLLERLDEFRGCVIAVPGSGRADTSGSDEDSEGRRTPPADVIGRHRPSAAWAKAAPAPSGGPSAAGSR